MNSVMDDVIERLLEIRQDLDDDLKQIKKQMERLETEYNETVVSKKNIETAIMHLRG